MASLRDIKNKSRRDLHNRMLVAAVYYESVSAEPVLINIRVHTEDGEHGDPSGTSLSYGEMHEVRPKVVFDRLEVDRPPRNSFVVVSYEEGYRVDTVNQSDLGFVTASVVRLDATDLAGKYTPETMT